MWRSSRVEVNRLDKQTRKCIADLKQRAGQLRRQYHFSRTVAGATSCWLGGVKTEHIGTVLVLMERERK